MREIKEFHQTGVLSIENREMFSNVENPCDVGLQVSFDGRIWLCVNGIAFIRFKPIKDK